MANTSTSAASSDDPDAGRQPPRWSDKITPAASTSSSSKLRSASRPRKSSTSNRLTNVCRPAEKQEVAREAIHLYLTDLVRAIEDREDELAIARYQLRKQLGEVAYVGLDEGAPPAWP
ncbi:hypothetical protein [Tenggerimyces flavus]|uniref:Uncharacterized protein n=1 Tax=Tenggerimyces flavus TaxID=1708749 RepID=A0ABV7YFC7_9ACTN|nr:hypothetical protein [Tenggerimyces flavus]MBM7790284.1 hypothetical protein [Tenggerimyces flavus]